MSEWISLSQIDQTTSEISSKLTVKPKIGLILGSGLGGLAEQINNPVFIPFEQISNWPVSTVIGHKGRLVIGGLEGQTVIVMQGRSHYYEGYSMAQIALPVRVMQRLGVKILIITNAAGAVNPDFEPGDVMLITDHLNFIGMAGLNPLRGPNLDELGPRFPDMGCPYDLELRQAALQTASQLGVRLHQGVYVSLAGPSFESPADLRFLRLAGADSVGMSTVPEVIAARHGGTSRPGFLRNQQ